MKIFSIDENVLSNIDITKYNLERSAANAVGLVASATGYIPTSVEDLRGYVPESVNEINGSAGSEFFIPIVILEEVPTGDERTFAAKSITKKDGPLELLWQIFTGKGHDGSVIVGRIDSIQRLDEFADESNENKTTEEIAKDGLTKVRRGWGLARGVFDTGVFGREAERLVRNGFLRGVSADMDQFEGLSEDTVTEDENSLSDNVEVIKNRKVTVNKARLIAATLVAKPAFQEAQIQIVEPEIQISAYDNTIVEDGVYEETMYDTSALAASAAPVVPPKHWFSEPKLHEKTPITVDDEGRVFGHIALWDSNHIGLPRATRPPRSTSNYAYFKTGVLRVDDGTDIHVGQLTLAGGHASIYASAQQAVKHYDDTSSAVADVTVGEDAYGIWVAGALRPSVSPEQVRVLRASAPSGDWRPINGRLELVAICQVNVPGFPVARSLVAGGQIMALVAAGAKPLAELKVKDLEDRVEALEQAALNEGLVMPDTSVLDQLALTAAASKAHLAINTLEMLSIKERHNELSSKITSLLF